ncbi:deacetylase [Aquitalea magnusonii]|jgi:acetoin utilization deacetylase AcuC-like enzyme|uniref:Deacetylase n=1 Tax=Aquitalea magnusonii TaxID=332411 RepID=A0A3G9GIB6_9NEIS|nr:histone deacetylase [Aquitalea magnusonii]BBF85257.1 deacetylase [Aquitalea magnusonii]
MRIYRTDQFPLPLPDGHRFPAEKYRLLADAVAAFAPHAMEEAPAASPWELQQAHAADYVAQVLDGSLPAGAWREIGLPWSPQLVERSRRSVGATIAAARSALLDGCGVNLAGGTHHAYRDKGSGFCVFNDVAVAARLLLQEALARRILVLDLDVHQGNGTAAIFRDEPRVFTFSMHGAKNFPFRKESSSLDIDLPDHTGDETYLALLQQHLPALLTQQQPDIVFYLAGADPWQGDRLGKLALSKPGLLQRDQLVMQQVRDSGAALVITMAGGYASNIIDTVNIQTNTVHAAWQLYGMMPAMPDTYPIRREHNA